MSDQYQLLDFGRASTGEGRKLESLGGYLIDRPSPAADYFTPTDPASWHRADARYDASEQKWIFARLWPDSLSVNCGAFRMPLRPTPYGHIGLFPEQAENWQWLGKPTTLENSSLNLFAYTGASTFALSAAGYKVAHVDAARPNVQAARESAKFNGWTEAPIRYLVDDAAKFVAREIRRGRSYHTIVLDPPTYGHGPNSKIWRLERDLWPLLKNCLALLTHDTFRMLVTGHSAEVDQADVAKFLKANSRNMKFDIESGRSRLTDKSGRSLDAGFYVRLSSR